MVQFLEIQFGASCMNFRRPHFVNTKFKENTSSCIRINMVFKTGMYTTVASLLMCYLRYTVIYMGDVLNQLKVNHIGTTISFIHV